MKCAGHVERMGDDMLVWQQVPREWRERGGKENRDCTGKTA